LELGHDVVSARDGFLHASDEALLALPHKEERVLITEDKDFGELVFLRGQPHPAIVRLVEMAPLERVAAMRFRIDHHGNAMREGAIMVVTGTRVRIRGREIMESTDE
jgi:predicted nuclease of predicted toxin-antitoxin system